MYKSQDAPQQNDGMTKIKIEEAIGTRLAHDITEIRPGEFKGPSFRRGHQVQEQDVCHLMRLGKRHLYVLDLKEGQVHEDDAVMELAEALAGPGVSFGNDPKEGKLQFTAAYDGLLKVNTRALVEFNLVPDVMCAAMHNNVPVTRGQKVAGTRAIPLVIKREALNRAVAIAQDQAPIFSIKTYHRKKIRLLITGSEVYDGLIEDRFEAIVKKKLTAFGASLLETVILPDDAERIAATVQQFSETDTDMIVTTGGMSVDPDDVTRHGIRQAGVDTLYYGSGVLPGAMFLVGELRGPKGRLPILGVPACALFHATTVLDLVLPRVLAGEEFDRNKIAELGHGGFCQNCVDGCRFPVCGFGRGS